MYMYGGAVLAAVRLRVVNVCEIVVESQSTEKELAMAYEL